MRQHETSVWNAQIYTAYGTSVGAACVAEQSSKRVGQVRRRPASRHNVLMYARRQMADRLAGGPHNRPVTTHIALVSRRVCDYDRASRMLTLHVYVSPCHRIYKVTDLYTVMHEYPSLGWCNDARQLILLSAGYKTNSETKTGGFRPYILV